MSPVFGSLFAGIGGFDLGLERAGMVCKWQVEIDAKCNEVLTHHWPDVARYGDVNDVGKRNLAAVDVLTGGFPCQDLSVAGKREGLAGSRSGLWFQFHRIITELEPRRVVIENVPGLLSSSERQDFAVILAGLTRRIPAIPERWGKGGFMRGDWYNVAWRVLDAQYFGVAQRRRRVFIVASLGDGSCAEILFESEGGAWDSPPGRETGERFAGTIAAGAHPGSYNGRDAERGMPITAIDVRNLREQPDGISGTLQHKKSGGYSLNYQNPVATFQNTGAGWWNDGPVGGTLRERDAKDGMTNLVAFPGMARKGWAPPSTPVDEDRTGPLDTTREMCVAFTERTRKDGRNLETQDELAYAITNPGGDGRAHSRQIAGQFGVRRLTPTECERLQGFPDNWTAVNGMSDSARYRMLGNAVAVPVAEWIGRQIMERDGGPR